MKVGPTPKPCKHQVVLGRCGKARACVADHGVDQSKVLGRLVGAGGSAGSGDGGSDIAALSSTSNFQPLGWPIPAHPRGSATSRYVGGA